MIIDLILVLSAYLLGILSGFGIGLYAVSRLLPTPTHPAICTKPSVAQKLMKGLPR